MITSSSLFEKVPCFIVSDFFPWLSDHCPLFFTLEIQKCVENSNSVDQKKVKAPKHYVWTERSKENYSTMINSPEFEAKLERSVEIDHSDLNLLVDYISNLLVDAAGKVEKSNTEELSRN